MYDAVQVQWRFIQYHERILALDPIAYWLLNERSGTIAYDWVSGRSVGAQNGTYARDTSVMGTGPGIGDGSIAPLYNGAADYTNIYSASLSAAFNCDEGTLLAWGRVAAGTWTDGTRRDAVTLLTDGNNYIIVRKAAANNTLEWLYVAGGVVEYVGLGGLSSTSFFSFGLSWSASADEVRAYYNGAQTGATQTVLGVWAGALSANDTVVGATNQVPANPWSGYLAHCAIWDRALSPDEIADLAVVE